MATQKKRPPKRTPKAKLKPKAKSKPKAKPKPKYTVRTAKRPSRPKKPSGIFLGLGALVLTAALIGFFAYLIIIGKPLKTGPPEALQESVSAPPLRYEIYPEETVPKETSPPAVSVPPPDEKPLACIIIDDMGYDKKLANRFLNLGVPLTFSILPFSTFQEDIARAADSKGMEIMLHLPMEPEEYPRVDPGPGALLTSMSPDELIRQLAEDIRSVPGAVGANNHMGSKMTAVSSQMYQIFSILKKEGLFFIDSRTTVNTLCKPSARLLQVPFAERDIFLDHEETADFVRQQIYKLIQKAEKNGSAIAIGHPHEVTIQVLDEMLPELKKRVRLVPASRVVERLG